MLRSPPAWQSRLTRLLTPLWRRLPLTRTQVESVSLHTFLCKHNGIHPLCCEVYYDHLPALTLRCLLRRLVTSAERQCYVCSCCEEVGRRGDGL